MKLVFKILSALSFLNATAYTALSFFVILNPQQMTSETVSFVCAFGFYMMSDK